MKKVHDNDAGEMTRTKNSAGEGCADAGGRWGCAGVIAARGHGRGLRGRTQGGSLLRNDRCKRLQGADSGTPDFVSVDRLGAQASCMGMWDTDALDNLLTNDQTCLTLDGTAKVD
jgi:hypothetical protein